MSLVIDAPSVEGKIRREAAKRGVSAAKYAENILATYLAPQNAAAGAEPFYATATLEQWNEEFDAWVDSHPSRRPLPDSAISGESFYRELFMF